jgi:hypothetical protein
MALAITAVATIFVVICYYSDLIWDQIRINQGWVGIPQPKIQNPK